MSCGSPRSSRRSRCLIWRDEDQLRFGCNLQCSMFNTVEGAALVVFFYSEFYFRSANYQFEYKNIKSLKRPTFPVIFQQPAAQGEKAALPAADQQTQSEYQKWLAGELHSHSPDEKLYFDASRTRRHSTRSSKTSARAFTPSSSTSNTQPTCQSRSGAPSRWPRGSRSRTSRTCTPFHASFSSHYCYATCLHTVLVCK